MSLPHWAGRVKWTQATTQAYIHMDIEREDESEREGEGGALEAATTKHGPVGSALCT